MARKKTRLQEEIEEILEAVGEVDPRLASLATLREQLPAEPRCPAGDSGDSTPAPGPIAQSLELEEALRRLQEEARRRRQEAEARKAEADAIRLRMEELAQERRRMEEVVRRARTLVAWAPPEEAQALAEQAQARIEAIEAEMREVAVRLQELETDEGVRRLRQEEAARHAQEEAARKAEEAWASSARVRWRMASATCGRPSVRLGVRPPSPWPRRWRRLSASPTAWRATPSSGPGRP
jgi:hypothetical protein